MFIIASKYSQIDDYDMTPSPNENIKICCRNIARQGLNDALHTRSVQ